MPANTSAAGAVGGAVGGGGALSTAASARVRAKVERRVTRSGALAPRRWCGRSSARHSPTWTSIA
eukprot:scaffold32467_cov53-Phaeocystis_antarctica.AAC.2